jgi:phospholipid/cholesterol/gamma-HCH transport system substrate-binding protein
VVTLAINKRYTLSADTSAGILTSGLLGESYVGLSPGGDPENLKPGDQIFLTQPAVDLIQLVGKYMFSGGGAQGGDKKDAAAPATNDVPAYLQGDAQPGDATPTHDESKP